MGINSPKKAILKIKIKCFLRFSIAIIHQKLRKIAIFLSVHGSSSQPTIIEGRFEILLSYLPCSHIWLNLDHRQFGYFTKLRKIKKLNHCSKRSQNRIARSPAGNTTLTSGSRQGRQSTTVVRIEDRRKQSEARLSSFVICKIKNARILVSWMIHFPLILMDDLNNL
jgi:hypothetical protein